METDMKSHIAAVRRYGAMTGNLTELSEDEEAQARADRRLFKEYLPAQEHGWDQAALLLRFMHEVCHIPLWQARECAVVIVGKSDAFRMVCGHAEHIANRIVQETGNVLIADAVALFTSRRRKELNVNCSGRRSWKCCG